MDQTSIKRLVLLSLLGVAFIAILVAVVWSVNQGRTPLYVRDMTSVPEAPISSVDVSEPNILGAFDLSLLEDMQAPVTAFLRSTNRELWLYSSDGQMLGLGIERVARVYNGFNTRWIVYQGFGDVTRGGSNTIYAFNLTDGKTKEIVHDDASENEVAVIGAGAVVSPNERYVAYRVGYLGLVDGYPSELVDPYPRQKNGVYVYDLVNDTSRYLGNAQGQIVWASDSTRVLLTEGIEYHDYDLSAGDFFVDVRTGALVRADNSPEAEALLIQKNQRADLENTIVSSFLKWIDDDTYIAVVIQPGSPLGGDLYEIDVDTGDMQKLTRLGDVVLF